MNIALSDTILYVTGKQGIENTTQQDLQTMVAEYPYFAPAQLVFAAKLKSENSFKLQTQIQKTGLFFNNFKWLQYQLMEASAGSFSPNMIASKPSTIIETIAPAEKVIEAVMPIAEVVSTENLEPVYEPANIAKENIETPTIPEFEKYDVAETIATNTHHFMPKLSIPTVEDVKGIMNGIDERREDVAEDVAENRTEEIDEPLIEKEVENVVANNTDNENIATTENVETINNLTQDDIVENIVTQEPVAEAPNEEISEQIIAAPVNDIHAEIAALKASWYNRNETEKEIQPVTENIVLPTEPVITTNAEKPQTTLESNIAALKNDWNKPLEDVANAPLPFETDPYYTIDYFASQGIKFDYTKEPQDKLTAKMLKFTDWLKKMKSPKQEFSVAIEEDPELDTTIQNIAAASNQSKEIITETMAEIFAKQGKTDKAIQLYIKLSFLIPHKSAYFATKLNELKGI